MRSCGTASAPTSRRARRSTATPTHPPGRRSPRCTRSPPGGCLPTSASDYRSVSGDPTRSTPAESLRGRSASPVRSRTACGRTPGPRRAGTPPARRLRDGGGLHPSDPAARHGRFAVAPGRRRLVGSGHQSRRHQTVPWPVARDRRLSRGSAAGMVARQSRSARPRASSLRSTAASRSRPRRRRAGPRRQPPGRVRVRRGRANFR